MTLYKKKPTGSHIFNSIATPSTPLRLDYIILVSEASIVWAPWKPSTESYFLYKNFRENN